MSRAGPGTSRAGEHLAEVRRRLERSRYEPDPAGLERLLSRCTPVEVWTRELPGEELPTPRLLPPTSLRIATAPLDLERSAEVLSAVLGEDLDVVRRHLGGNLRHVDGAAVLLATRWGENVVGTVTLVLTEDAEGTVAGVHGPAVAGPVRGRGIGTALLSRALALATAAGATLAVTTLPAPRDPTDPVDARPATDPATDPATHPATDPATDPATARLLSRLAFTPAPPPTPTVRT